jgi:tight adherence protein B
LAAIIAVLFFITTFLAAAVAVLIGAFVQGHLQAIQDMQPGRQFRIDNDAGEDTPVLLQEQGHSSISVLEVALHRLNVVDRMRKLLDDAGLRWSVGRLTATMLLCGAIAGALFMDVRFLPPGSAIVAFFIGASLPYMYVGMLRQKRMDQFESQFPDALESMARAMRAGHPLQGAIDILAADTPAPLGAEFRRIRDERRLGMAWKPALDNFAQRVPILEVRLFVAAATLSSRSGGRFTEVLENLAETLREGVALRGEVKAISAHGRLTGTILTVLPFAIALMLYLTSPAYILTLVNHPIGPLLIGGALGLIFAGHLVIQQIVKVRL